MKRLPALMPRPAPQAVTFTALRARRATLSAFLERRCSFDKWFLGGGRVPATGLQPENLNHHAYNIKLRWAFRRSDRLFHSWSAVEGHSYF